MVKRAISFGLVLKMPNSAPTRYHIKKEQAPRCLLLFDTWKGLSRLVFLRQRLEGGQGVLHAVIVGAVGNAHVAADAEVVAGHH